MNINQLIRGIEREERVNTGELRFLGITVGLELRVMAVHWQGDLLIKGKEEENHKELNWSTLKIAEQLAKCNSNPRRNWD